jgi:HAD superfamily hydrolase (TIGR01509 family)
LDAPVGVDAVLFDLDGTLVDSLPALREVYRLFLADRVPADAAPPFERWTGTPLADVVASLEADLGLPGGRQALMADYERILGREYVARVELARGAADLVGEVRARGARAAVVTSASRPTALAVLERLALADGLDAVIGAEDAERAKPAPDPYLAALRWLDVPAAKAVAVEDSPGGVAAAVAAGVRCIALADPAAEWPAVSGATTVAADLPAAREALDALGL